MRLSSRRSSLGPITLAGLHDQALLSGRKFQSTELGDLIGLIRNESQVVLAAKFLLNRVVDLFDALFFRNFKERSPRVFGEPHENSPAIRPEGKVWPGEAGVGKQDGINERVSALRRLYRIR